MSGADQPPEDKEEKRESKAMMEDQWESRAGYVPAELGTDGSTKALMADRLGHGAESKPVADRQSWRPKASKSQQRVTAEGM